MNQTLQNRNQEKKTTLFVAFILFLACFLVDEASASAWNVDLTLKRDTIEDAMVMPSAVFVDEGREQYYVVDSGKHRILSFDRQANLLHVFKAGGALEIPVDMVRTTDGTIWVVEKGKNSLTMIDLQGQKTIPHSLSFQGKTIYPHRLETDGENLYVQDKASGDIVVYDGSLQEKQRIGCDTCSQGFFDFKIKDDTIWTLDRQGKSVYSYAKDGALKDHLSLGEYVTYPVSLAVGPSGYLYVLDLHDRDVAVFDTSGVFKYRFLQPGISSGQLYYPTEIMFDPWEGLCVTDEGNARVEIYKR